MKKMKSILKNNRKIRIQFELNEQGAQELEKLMEATDVATRKDLFNNALTLLEWAIKEKRKGRTIASLDEKEQKYKEIEMPILSRAAKSKVSLVIK
ncbi:hypothetical protein ES702_07488 [subsurface metagenome]